MTSGIEPEQDREAGKSGPLAVILALAFAAVALPAVYPAPQPWEGVLATAILGLMLALLSAIDVKTMRLPNGLTYPLAALGLAQSALMAPGDLALRLLGAALGFAMLALVAEAYRRKRGIQGLGLGDAKLLGAGGAWIGALGLPSALLIASSSALVLALLAKAAGREVGLHTRMPFGPFIATGIWIIWLYGPIV